LIRAQRRRNGQMVTLVVNGKSRTVNVDPATPLLYVRVQAALSHRA